MPGAFLLNTSSLCRSCYGSVLEIESIQIEITMLPIRGKSKSDFTGTVGVNRKRGLLAKGVVRFESLSIVNWLALIIAPVAVLGFLDIGGTEAGTAISRRTGRRLRSIQSWRASR